MLHSLIAALTRFRPNRKSTRAWRVEDAHERAMVEGIARRPATSPANEAVPKPK
jgi:hypothetical protein